SGSCSRRSSSARRPWGGSRSASTASPPTSSVRNRFERSSRSPRPRRARARSPRRPLPSTVGSSASWVSASWRAPAPREDVVPRAGATRLWKRRGPALPQATHTARRLVLPPDLNHLALLGRQDEHLRALETQYDVRITARGHDVMLRGEERQVAEA